MNSILISKYLNRAGLIILFLLGCSCTNAAEPKAAEPETVNTGQYIFRPLRRFDIRQQVRQLSSATDLHITIFRFDLPMHLNEGKDGTFSPRIDIPLIASDSVGYDKPNGDTYEYASGDLFLPFDIMLGKLLNKNTVLSVDFAAPIVNDYNLYDWLLELRIGFFF